MAKKTKKKKEKKGKSLGERLPRPGLPVILIAVLGLASVSFITLGILKSEPEPEMPAQEIKHNMTVKITPEDRQKIKEASAKSQPKPGQPSPDPGAVKVPRVKPPPTETAAGAGTPTAEGSTAAATEQPVAAGGTAPQAAPAKTTAKESGETAPPATAGSPPSETAATEKTVVAKAQPGSGQATAPTSKAATASTEAPPETKTPAADEQKAKPSLPKPVWQTVDQNWDKVKIDESPSGTGGTGGVWKQLEVGETDKGRETGTAPAEPESTPAKAETAPEKAAPQTVVASPAPAKPKPKTTVRKSTKRTWKKRPRKKTVRPKPIRLAIINESGQAGQAEVYRDVLVAMGYPVARLENRTQRNGPTTILYGSGSKYRARTLAKHIPGDRALIPDSHLASNEIIILVR